MTHTEKLQQIFEAALKDNSEFNKPFIRAFPASLAAKPVAVGQPAAEPAPSPEPVVEAPAKPFVIPAAPAASAGLSESESAEPGKLLAEQQQQKTRKRRRDALMTLGVLTILTGNAFSWFVNSPQRVVAFNEAIQDIRSVGDVKSMGTKYQVALDKIAVRSKQIGEATASTGGNGNTTGQRNQMVQHAFGAMKNDDAANNLPTTAALTSDGSYR